MSRRTLSATPRQIDALKAMSKEVESSWYRIMKSSATAWVAGETIAAGIPIDDDFFTNADPQVRGGFIFKSGIPAELARLYGLVLDSHTFEWKIFLDSDLLKEQPNVRAKIARCMKISNRLVCPFQRSIFVHLTLNDALGGVIFGDVFVRILQSIILVDAGYFPASLMARRSLFSVGSISNYIPVRDFSVYDYFSNYRDACAIILKADPKTIINIRQEVALRALEVFSDARLSERWLNTKMKRYNYLTPNAAVALGYMDVIFEHLDQIDNGFFG